MLQSLPRETVFEVREKNRRTTRILFAILLLMYVVFFNILIIVGWVFIAHDSPGTVKYFFSNFWVFCGSGSVVALIFAWIHFSIASSKRLDTILIRMGATNADRQDRYHSRFVNIVEEAEAATGIRPIRAVVLPTVGCNAFSLADGKGNAAIGVTEGLVSRLDRSELSAVVAHEAAHLVHEDSRLSMRLGAMLGVFQLISGGLKGAAYSFGRRRYRPYRRSSRNQGGQLAAVIALWAIASLQQLLISLLVMAVSRKREFMADAHAVEMCSDPLALAEALYKISGRYRGSMSIPEGFASAFILNPKVSKLDETQSVSADMFSTHPPMPHRLDKLLKWAQADLRSLKKKVHKEIEQRETALQEKDSKKQEAPPLYARKGDKWEGPYTPMQMLSLGLLNPMAWVGSPDGDVMRASENPFCLPLLQEGIGENVSERKCPRCNVSMVVTDYEGAPILHCTFCDGHLLKGGVLERLISRHDKKFSGSKIKEAKAWRSQQKGQPVNLCGFPAIKCPTCGAGMKKAFHSYMTKVVIDRCCNVRCGSIWCDGGELDNMQMLVEGVEDFNR
jgi:heat shock protein HtpX